MTIDERLDGRLLHIAQVHENRITRLEGGSSPQ
jgi:hypothetical protein